MSVITSTVPRAPQQGQDTPVGFGRLHRMAAAATAGLELRQGVLAAQVEIGGPPEALFLHVTCRLRPESDEAAVTRAVEQHLIPLLEAEHHVHFLRHRVDVHAAEAQGTGGAATTEAAHRAGR